MLLQSRRLAKTDISAGNRSIGRSLVLYWLCMALAMLAAALLLLSVTGVLSRTARQFGETAALQQNNTAALFTAQMDALSAQGIELSETVSGELERFLACRSLSFDALNDDPALIAELETALIPSLETTMAGSTCSGVYFCLDATANTSLPQSKTSRMGVYLRYSGLRSAHPSGSIACFRGTVDAARANGLQLHNRWNPELDTSLIPGYRQVMTWEGDRLSGGCLWTERVPLLDTWENVTLLCVPVRDGSGTVRGICGMELSELYFGLSHSTVSGPYGSFVMLLAPMNGDTLLLDKAMLGSTEGTDLSASGEMKIRGGRDYDTFIWNDTAYLGKYQIIPGRLADGYPLAAVTLVPESGYHNRAQSARIGWGMGSLGFLVGMLALAAAPPFFHVDHAGLCRSQKSGAGLAAYGHSGDRRADGLFSQPSAGETVRGCPAVAGGKPCVRADRPGEGTDQYGARDPALLCRGLCGQGYFRPAVYQRGYCKGA